MIKILVPVDFSIYALNASVFAINIAKKIDAHIEFFHLVSTPVDWIKLDLDKEKNYPQTKSKIGHAKTELKKLVNLAKSENIDVSKSLEFSREGEELFHHIDTHNYDYIFIGSHGGGAIKDRLLGSNALQILRHVKNPLVIVKKNIPKTINRIAFVSDFRDVSRSAFKEVIAFAEQQNTHIELLFINTPNHFTVDAEVENNMNQMLKHCNRNDKCTKNIINSTTILDGIEEFASNNNIDMLAMCTHNHSSISLIFHTSLAELVAKSTNLPMLNIKLND